MSWLTASLVSLPRLLAKVSQEAGLIDKPHDHDLASFNPAMADQCSQMVRIVAAQFCSVIDANPIFSQWRTASLMS